MAKKTKQAMIELTDTSLGEATSSLVNDLYTWLKKSGKKEFAKWRINGGARSLSGKLKRYQMVRTILNVDRPTNLSDFYYPTTVKEYGVVRRIQDMKPSQPLLIRGHVGQGKSIFLRYLATQELNENTGTIPLFLELRNMQSESLKLFMFNELRSLNLEMDDELFDYFCSNGRFTFLFDGFDEINQHEQSRAMRAIKSLSDKYPASKVVISTRLSSGIASVAWCKYVDILPVPNYAIPDVIERLAGPELGESILARVRSKQTKLYSLLSSPLMIALLIVRFRVEQTVPETDFAFFSDLFDLLLRRHDQGKEGFRRQRRSKLSDYDMGRVFGGVSFLTSTQIGASEFPLSKLIECIVTICNRLSLEDKPERIAEDIIGITNLIVEEGGHCRFVHRSIQEFHTANFVAMIGGKFAQKFYTEALKSADWLEEIRFLKKLDTYGYQKYFLLPLLNIVSKRTASNSWMADLTGIEGGERINVVQSNRFNVLFEGYIDLKLLSKISAYDLSEMLKTLRNKIEESVTQYERLTELAKF